MVLRTADIAAGAPCGRTPSTSRADRSYWWLQTSWLGHRNTIENVHPLLIALQDARGTGFMTAQHVVDVLNAKDPDSLVRKLINATPTASPIADDAQDLSAVQDA
jgi:hypothetical protein